MTLACPAPEFQRTRSPALKLRFVMVSLQSWFTRGNCALNVLVRELPMTGLVTGNAATAVSSAGVGQNVCGMSASPVSRACASKPKTVARDLSNIRWRCYLGDTCPGERPMGTTSLKLPEELKRRAGAAAQRMGKTAHAFMVDAIERAATAAEARARLVAEAEAARRTMLKSGKGYAPDEVHQYLRKRIAGKKPIRPKARTWRG